MTKSVIDYSQALHEEIDQIPAEYLGALLNIVHTFRQSVTAISAEQSIEQGLKEALL